MLNIFKNAAQTQVDDQLALERKVSQLSAIFDNVSKSGLQNKVNETLKAGEALKKLGKPVSIRTGEGSATVIYCKAKKQIVVM